MSYAPRIGQHAENYDDSFYLRQQEGSENSAAKIVEHLISYYKPKTLIDIGCGRGSWLKAFGDTDVTKLVGVDGPWDTQSDMLDQRIQLFQSDLTQPESIQVEGRFDLAMSLEVAEHLPPISRTDL